MAETTGVLDVPRFVVDVEGGEEEEAESEISMSEKTLEKKEFTFTVVVYC